MQVWRMKRWTVRKGPCLRLPFMWERQTTSQPMGDKKRTVSWRKKTMHGLEKAWRGDREVLWEDINWAKTSRMRRRRNHVYKDLVWREPFRQRKQQVQRPWGRELWLDRETKVSECWSGQEPDMKSFVGRGTSLRIYSKKREGFGGLCSAVDCSLENWYSICLYWIYSISQGNVHPGYLVGSLR